MSLTQPAAGDAMQSSTDAGKDGTRKFTAPQPKQQQQHQQSLGAAGAGAESATGAANQTTSFTINGNNPAPTTNTPSKNPFKQQLENNQQNGNTETDCGIMGKEQLPPVPPYNPQPMTAGQQPPPDVYRQEDPRAAGHWSAAKSWMVSWRGSNRLVLVIVAIALLLDNMLLTTVVGNAAGESKHDWE
ncbi:hypothetical protein ACLKA6_005373 [Drosophila palustris]